MDIRARSLRWIAAHLFAIGIVLAALSAKLGVVTTTAASLALVAGAIAILRGRTWGALFTLAVGTSFATAASLGMTNAPAIFAFVAIMASVPVLILARPMWRFDRAATIAAVIGAIAWGAASAAAVRELPTVATALGRAEAAWDRWQGRVEMRFCAGPSEDSFYEHRLEERLGVTMAHVGCGESALRDTWNAGYDASTREDVEARCGEGALEAVLWSHPRCSTDPPDGADAWRAQHPPCG